MNVSSFECTIATDLKLANILTGLMSHSSLYPCTYCFAKKDELEGYDTYRTVGNTLQYYEAWMKAGASKTKAKEFKNCIHPPLFDTSESKTFLEIIIICMGKCVSC